MLTKRKHISHYEVEYTGRVRGDKKFYADLGLSALQQLLLAVEAKNHFAGCSAAETEASLPSSTMWCDTM